MSDNLKWMNRHAVLLREPQWEGIAVRENYKIRPDLMPLFKAHPDSQDLLDAMAGRKLWREGCEFIARMAHRRAAVWWGYCCLMDIFAERQAVASGAVKPASPVDAFLPMLGELEKMSGIKIPPPKPPTDENIDEFCRGPDVDVKKLLEFPKPPPQDRSALAATTAAIREKTGRLRAFVPPAVGAAYRSSLERAEATTRGNFGFGIAEHYEQMRAMAESGRLTYTVDRLNHPMRKQVLELPAKLEEMRKDTLKKIKAAFPEKYPATPEAALLLKADAKRKSDTAVQAVWRWIVSPDERNTTLAMEAGNACAGTPEGLLAYTAAWSFGDLAPEGKVTVPVPPELPGTGLNSALLLMAMDQDGHREMKERYEIYFNLGMDVLFGKNLWPDDVSQAKPPHQRLEDSLPNNGGFAR